MPALGGDARLIAKDGHDPRFSPDGASLAFWAGPWLGGQMTAGAEVFVMPAMGGTPRPVASGFASARNPVWAPDGKSLLLFGRAQGKDGPEPPDWWWAPLDGRPPVATGALRAFAAAGVDTSALSGWMANLLPSAWTKGGVWTGAWIDESVKLWRLQISPLTGKVEGRPLQVSSGPGHHGVPSVDRDGRVAFRASLATAAIGALPLDANRGRAAGAPVRLATDGADGAHRGSVDPEGRVLAYPKHRPTETELWLKNLATGQQRHLVTTSPSQLNPIVSPDATRVAYTVDGPPSVGWLVAAAGGVPQKLCEGCIVRGWHPDARRLLVSTPYPDSTHVRLLSVDGGADEPVLPPEVVSGRADTSPDGRWLVFTARGEPGRRIFLAPLRPGRPPARDEWRPLDVSAATAGTRGAIGAERPVGWSPDGRLLYLLLEPDGFRCLHALAVDPVRGVETGPPFAVHHFHDPQRLLSSTPFGSGIVKDAFIYDQYETTASIWLLEPRRPSALD